MHALVGPRADAWGDQQVQAVGIPLHFALREAQGTLDAASLVAVHTAGDERSGQFVEPVWGLQGVQGVLVVSVVQAAVGHHLEAPAKSLDHGHHLHLVGAVTRLSGSPFRISVSPKAVLDYQ